MKYILVAGGAGFLGNHLCRRLILDGHRVQCVDNLQTGSLDLIGPLLDHERFSFHEGDVRVLDGRAKSILPLGTDPFEFDEIYNLASPASPKAYQKDPIGTMMTNVQGTHNLLTFAMWAGAKYLQASTSEVYGSPIIHPQPEEYVGNVNPIGPRACYDEGKRAAESLCADYRRMQQVDAKIVRIFNTYGPYLDPEDGRVVSNFIMQALKNKPITIYGTGDQTRSFCYVDDLIEGFIKMMNSTYSGPINLGNPNEFTISELAYEIIEQTGSKSKIVYQELPEDDPVLRCPVISRAKNFLNWAPKVQLEEGLSKTIAYFKGRWGSV